MCVLVSIKRHFLYNVSSNRFFCWRTFNSLIFCNTIWWFYLHCLSRVFSRSFILFSDSFFFPFSKRVNNREDFFLFSIALSFKLRQENSYFILFWDWSSDFKRRNLIPSYHLLNVDHALRISSLYYFFIHFTILFPILLQTSWRKIPLRKELGAAKGTAVDLFSFQRVDNREKIIPTLI